VPYRSQQRRSGVRQQRRSGIWSLFERFRSDTGRRDQRWRPPTFGGSHKSHPFRDIWETFYSDFEDMCSRWNPPGRESREDWLATHGATKTVYEETFALVKQCKTMALRKEGYKASESIRGGGQEVLVFCYLSFVIPVLALLNGVYDIHAICLVLGCGIAYVHRRLHIQLNGCIPFALKLLLSTSTITINAQGSRMECLLVTSAITG